MVAVAAASLACVLAGVASAATPAVSPESVERAPDDAAPSASPDPTATDTALEASEISLDGGTADAPTLDILPALVTPPAPTVTGPAPMGPDSSSQGSTSGPSRSLGLVEKRKASKNPFRNSALVFDQSITTQTVGVGEAPLTYMPVYQWWLSFQPRYYFTEHLYLAGRFDYYKAFTNSDDGPGGAGATTDYREDDFGDLRTTIIYEQWMNESKTIKLSAGPRILWPTSKTSQGEGIYVQAGAVASYYQKVPIHEASAPFLDDFHYRFGLWYQHPFSRATTPTNPNFQYVREDTDGQSFLSDQLAGSTLVDHQLILSVGASLQVTPRVVLDLDLFDINQWHYTPTGGQCVVLLGGECTSIPLTPDSPTFTQLTWLVASIDWDVFDQLSLGLGYYNLQNELSLTGQSRSIFGSTNIWWSPDARFFFDITANLDAIYDSLAPKGSVRKAAQEAREETVRQLSNTRF